MQLSVVVAVFGALAAKACLGRATNAAQVNGLQFSFSDPEREHDVVVLDVSAEDRLDYKIANEDGSYQYGYQTGRLQGGGHSFKHEYRRPDGVLFGQHGQKSPEGVLTSTNYVADSRGFRVLEDGQEYVPVSKTQLHLRRAVPEQQKSSSSPDLHFKLNPRTFSKISDLGTVRMESDPDKLLEAKELIPQWSLDPDTGEYRFSYRSVTDRDSVAFRTETRRADGVTFGQFGHRSGQHEPASVVSFVSDALGYRLVNPGQGEVPVLSRSEAVRLQKEGKLNKKIESENRSIDEMKPDLLARTNPRPSTISSLTSEEESSGFPPVNSAVPLPESTPDNEISIYNNDEKQDTFTFDNHRRKNGLNEEVNQIYGEPEDHNITETNKQNNEIDTIHSSDADDNKEKEDEGKEDDAEREVFASSHSAAPGETNYLDSVVVEAANDLATLELSNGTQEHETENGGEQVPPILQVLARYPPSLTSAKSAQLTSDNIPSLLPYGAVKHLLTDSTHSAQASSSHPGPRVGSIDLGSEQPLVVKYQSLPYALVPLSLLPIRTYEVVQSPVYSSQPGVPSLKLHVQSR